MIVVYNNAARWNWIDAFVVSTAMFGTYVINIGLDEHRVVQEGGRGYHGKRRTTKDHYRSLSAIFVLRGHTERSTRLEAYHNPFATNPIDPEAIKPLVDAQFLHPNPHSRGFIPWAPNQIA